MTARAGLPIDAPVDGTAHPVAVKTEGQERPRSPSSSLWAMLLARIYDRFPLVCPHCAASMTLIAFVTDRASIKRILDDVGEPVNPPPISPARGPPRMGGLRSTRRR